MKLGEIPSSLPRCFFCVLIPFSGTHRYVYPAANYTIEPSMLDVHPKPDWLAGQAQLFPLCFHGNK
jgi:hypothetical protein